MTARVNLVLPFSCVFIQINQVGHIKSLCDLTALVWRAVEITHESSQLVTLGGLRVHLHQVSVTIGATITRKQREHNYWKTERTQLPVNRENTITRKQREHNYSKTERKSYHNSGHVMEVSISLAYHGVWYVKKKEKCVTDVEISTYVATNTTCQGDRISLVSVPCLSADSSSPTPHIS